MTSYFEILLNSKYTIFGVIGFCISSLAYAVRVIWRIIKEYKVLNLINDNRDIFIGRQGEITVTNLNKGNTKKTPIKKLEEKIKTREMKINSCKNE